MERRMEGEKRTEAGRRRVMSVERRMEAGRRRVRRVERRMEAGRRRVGRVERGMKVKNGFHLTHLPTSCMQVEREKPLAVAVRGPVKEHEGTDMRLTRRASTTWYVSRSHIVLSVSLLVVQ